MDKISIIGPKKKLFELLELVRELGLLQIEEQTLSDIPQGVPGLEEFHPDRQSIERCLFYESLQEKIAELKRCLPAAQIRQSYLDPASSIDSAAALIEKHLSTCRSLAGQKERILIEFEDLHRYSRFLKAIAPLVEGLDGEAGLDLIGMELREEVDPERLQRRLERSLGSEVRIGPIQGEGKERFALLVSGKGQLEGLKKGLAAQNLAGIESPPFLADLPFASMLPATRERLDALQSDLQQVEERRENYARRWLPLYQGMAEWVEGRLALLEQARTSLFQTELCFYLLGWIRAEDRLRLQRHLKGRFGDEVVVEELDILERDLENVPITLKNPTYFQPFEIFSRLLPLPRYTSFDPTPFIGIFFPLFFGMILGDIGYGAVLLLLVFILLKACANRPLVVDAAKVLGVCALYTMVFGWLYGECFGELGSHWFGIEPICFDRMEAILPMLYFALAVGTVHVSLGMLLGLFAAVKKGKRKEALFRLLGILLLFILVVLLLSFLLPIPTRLRQPLMVAIAVLLPLLLLTGGLLAPLEMLKNFGSIISYARIMAIGLGSVLLAFVANQLAGMAGSIWLGIIIAFLLHSFNIVLGVFAPTVHSLRLHFVEFFGKFMEPGGREFRPWKKP